MVLGVTLVHGYTPLEIGLSITKGNTPSMPVVNRRARLPLGAKSVSIHNYSPQHTKMIMC